PTGPSPYRAFHPRLQQLPYAQQTTRDNRWLPPRVYHSQLGHMVQVFRHGAAQRDLAGVAGEHAADMRRGSMADNLISSNPEPTQVVGGGPAVTAQDLTKALKEVERSKRRRAIGRRALIVGAGAAACVGAFELAPQIAKNIEGEIGKDFAKGFEAGKQALANELLGLEEVSLDVAIGVADLTQFGASTIIRPLANLASTIAGGGLSVLARAVQDGRDAPGNAGANCDWLNSLASLLAQWSATVSQSKLGDFIAIDVTLADKYLRALRDRLEREAKKPPPPANPTATPKP